MKLIKIFFVGVSWVVFFSYLFIFGVFAYVAHYGELLGSNKVLAMIGGGVFSALCFGGGPIWLLDRLFDNEFKLKIIERYGKETWDATILVVSILIPTGLSIALILAWVQMFPKAMDYYNKYF